MLASGRLMDVWKKALASPCPRAIMIYDCYKVNAAGSCRGPRTLLFLFSEFLDGTTAD